MASNHIKIINLLDEIKQQIPEGIYLQLCNELKENKENYDELSSIISDVMNDNLNLEICNHDIY